MFLFWHPISSLRESIRQHHQSSICPSHPSRNSFEFVGMKFSSSCLLLWCCAKHRKQQKFVYSRNRHCLRSRLGPKDRYICQRWIPRCSLLFMSRSPWRRVYASGDDQAMITLTGFDFRSFHHLLSLFAQLYNQYTPFVNADGFIIQKVSLCWVENASCPVVFPTIERHHDLRRIWWETNHIWLSLPSLQSTILIGGH